MSETLPIKDQGRLAKIEAEFQTHFGELSEHEQKVIRTYVARVAESVVDISRKNPNVKPLTIANQIADAIFMPTLSNQ